ncbi:MAG: dihydroorotate dehydrogenase, partial [Oscillospiraceae bacterium]|nr:dihydroorotate dehydrogenase [Oscillospiraceae bacterium]
MGRLSTNLCGIELDSPIIPASGTFGYGYEYAELYDINVLGTFSFKGTTREPRFGNPTPRIAEAPSGMLNAVGLQNPGVDKVISEELPRLARVFGKPVMANVSGFSVDEYVETCAKLDSQEQVGWLEVNISCPNVHGGGMSFGTSADSAAEVTREVKKVTSKPVIMKLSPNVTDIVAIARACEEAGADGISLINTLMGMRLDIRRRRPILANRTGGLSGPAVFPIALRMVWDVYNAVSIPVIGMGGVSSAEDVIEMMLAGASAVEIGSANLTDPF